MTAFVDSIHRGGTILIAGRYLKEAVSAQRRIEGDFIVGAGASQIWARRR
jgi:hypothetical protein